MCSFSACHYGGVVIGPGISAHPVLAAALPVLLSD